MGTSSEELDPLAELRESLDGGSAGVPAPPPLPVRRVPLPQPKAATGSMPAYRPAMSVPSVQIPIRPSDFPPEQSARPVGAADPFAEPPEPRMPLGGSPEEKVEYFRAVLKQKTETLSRARSLYEARDSDLQTMQISDGALRGQVRELTAQRDQSSAMLTRESARTSAAESKAAQAQAELQRLEADRQDLSRALAEVEVELASLTGQLREERESRGALAEELIGAKEALSLAQDRVAELAAERAEMQGALEAVQSQYQDSLAELEHLGEDLRGAVREREQLATEREGLVARTAELEATLAESEWSRSSLDEAQARHHELESSLEAVRAELLDTARRLEASEVEVVRLRDQLEADAAALSEAAEIAEARAAQLESDLEQSHEELGALKAQKAQQAAEEAELGIEELDAGAQAREAEEQAERLRQRVKMLEGALETSRNRTTTLEAEAAVRSSLEDRVAELEAESAGREALQARVVELEAERAEHAALQARMAELEAESAEREALQARVAELEAERAEAPPPAAEPSEEWLAEREQLRADLAVMKRKLMTAETALETAAAHKAKVARLEAQLAQLKGAK